jgi:hypothetical protein
VISYSAFFTWPGGDDCCSWRLLDDDEAAKRTVEDFAGQPWAGWPRRTTVHVQLNKLVNGKIVHVADFDVNR